VNASTLPHEALTTLFVEPRPPQLLAFAVKLKSFWARLVIYKPVVCRNAPVFFFLVSVHRIDSTVHYLDQFRWLMLPEFNRRDLFTYFTLVRSIRSIKWR